MKLASIVLCCVCVNFAFAVTYKAAVSNSDAAGAVLSWAREAAGENIDVMVLPSHVTDSEDYDETVNTLSEAAKQAGVYLVAHLREKTLCRSKQEVIRSNLVFDRQGAIVAVSRRPQNSVANCTTATPGLMTFDTDFGVTFGVMMEEDLVLSGELMGLKNFVVAGDWASEIPYFSGAQFSGSRSYANDANLVTSSGIYAGRAGLHTGHGNLRVAELQSRLDENTTRPPVIDAANMQRFPSEDLSQYIIRPLDLVAGTKGYKEIVCHNRFCCEFDLKTRSKVFKDEVSYGLAAFDGVRHYGGSRYIGAQNCAVFACAGRYKRSCGLSSFNNTHIAFKELSISANFTNESAIYPVIVSNQQLLTEQFEYATKTSNVQTVKMTVTDGNSLLTFGIFGRVFDRDYESFSAKENSDDFYDYIFTEDVQEFFDYLWIRIRILMFVVSIYILEML